MIMGQGQVLGIVYHVIATHLIKKSGRTHRTAHTITHRVGRFLERHGLLERDAKNSFLAGMRWTRILWINCWGIPLPTVSSWDRRQGARYSQGVYSSYTRLYAASITVSGT